MMISIIVLSGTLLRAYELDYRQIDGDEAFAWRVAKKPLTELLITAAGDTTPPAHYVLLKIWMNVCSQSPVALRALSVLCGLLLIAVVYALVVETALWGNSSIAAAQFGGLAAALLTAIHSFQLEPNRTARMYGLGALLEVLTAWILLRALRANSRPTAASNTVMAHADCLLVSESQKKTAVSGYAWWLGYGATAALFLLTHHFAMLALAAQGAFAFWCAFAKSSNLCVHQRTTRCGVILATGVGLMLYAPWLPAAVAQTRRVNQSFWIQERSVLEWGQTFVRWCVGIDWAGTTLIASCIGGAAIIAVRALGVRSCTPDVPRSEASCRGLRGLHYNPAAIALLAQAALPWVVVGLISTFGKHPLLQDRYMAFSQASWLALLGVTIASVQTDRWRVGLSALLIVATLTGTLQFIRALPNGPPGIVAATDRLASDYRDGGIVLVNDAPSANCLRFYLSQVGTDTVDVRASDRPWPRPGHINHIASLGSSEFLSRVEDLAPDVPQLWFAGTKTNFPFGSKLPGWEWNDEVTYKGHGPQAPDYVLRRYERPTQGEPNQATRQH
jgi:hypothetical protein